jgi:hypothetical protein
MKAGEYTVTGVSRTPGGVLIKYVCPKCKRECPGSVEMWQNGRPVDQWCEYGCGGVEVRPASNLPESE